MWSWSKSEPTEQKFVQVQKNKDVQQATQRQVMVTDLYGRLFSEIERVLVCSGIQIQPKFKKYLLNEFETHRGALINIETFSQSLDCFASLEPSKSHANYLKKEVNYIQHLKKATSYLGPERIAERAIITQVLKDIENGHAKVLPPELSGLLISEADRKGMREDLVSKNQLQVLRMNAQTQDILGQLDSQFKAREDHPEAAESGSIPVDPSFNFQTKTVPY